MDYRKLRYLITVAETKNITKAAQSLFISQSALSHYIKNVEDELGVFLFDRSTTPISLTQAGTCYIESARRILLENDRLNKELRDITQHMTGKLTIGTSRDRASYMMPRLIPPFAEKYPGIDVEIYTGSRKNLLDVLQTGRVDLVLLPSVWEQDAIMRGFCSELIYLEELVLAAKKGSIPFSDKHKEKKTVPSSVLKELPLYMLFQEHAMRTYCDQFFRQEKIRPHIKMEFSSNITCYRMAATGMGAAIIPYLTTRLTNMESNIELFPLGDPPKTWEVRVFYRKDEYIGQPELDFIQIARDMFANELL